MNPFRVGDRVWYWDGASRTVYGTVTAIERLADGTQVLVITRDHGGQMSLPADTVTKIT
ncbi:uncharacterized protein SCHCODRAFT_02699348 [Schizophyllum commune H4-8]|uniref:uncharacterized protein n=1 Tax=Schizophyllum commune (strain H4-8 / FGSC 9210) TaxID=578458 RepID=UPI00215E9BF0|nr:uncharacterized protein SCHCODRAFT_02699348 [Schizophyllum commune H4-8]KAI5895453.1 hypothetical protein SCHCODRAFT_02699348 [Schizophyllum commune H4-8]